MKKKSDPPVTIARATVVNNKSVRVARILAIATLAENGASREDVADALETLAKKLRGQK